MDNYTQAVFNFVDTNDQEKEINWTHGQGTKMLQIEIWTLSAAKQDLIHN